MTKIYEHEAVHNTTYSRAIAGYDKRHEHDLLEALAAALFERSRVSDTNAIVIRTGEAASALLTCLASVLAMSPSAVRSPTAIRKTVDELGKRLRKRVAAAEQNADMQTFIRRCFNGSDVEGNA
jgi:hypothetical protein